MAQSKDDGQRAINPDLNSRACRTLTRSELSQAVYKQIGTITRHDAHRLVAEVFDEIQNALDQGEDVKLRGFGKFKLRNKNERVGRNPKTKETATITARRVVTFSPSNNMRAIVNGDEAIHDEEK